MATRKHKGLGRGLDSLIPVQETRPDENKEENIGGGDHSPGVAADHQAGEHAVSAQTVRTIPAGPVKEGNIDGLGIVKMVRIARIEPDRRQPRKNFDKDKLVELADSIRENGLIEPLTVQDDGTHYTLINGERRWRAAKLAGLKEIPCIIKNYDETQKVIISLIDNVQREDLNPIEEAEAYQRLIEEFHMKQEDVAKRVSKDRSTITNLLRLLKLCDEVRYMVAAGQLSMGQARALVPVEDEELQKSLAQKIVAEGMSVREVERLVKSLGKSKTQRKKEQDEALAAIYRDVAEKMNQALGMKVDIKSKGKKGGSLMIQFSSQDELEQLMDKLM